jgi:hypothetical protein
VDGGCDINTWPATGYDYFKDKMPKNSRFLGRHIALEKIKALQTESCS